jgi:isopentenyl phosphate kinase
VENFKGKLIFLKLGGSLITKKKPYTLNLKKIKEIAKEIHRLRKKYKFKLLIGNGAGSFAHVSAKKFKTKEGYINKKSKIGHCIVQDDASTLNRILVKELIKAGEKAISVQPSAFILCSKRKIKSFFLDPIKNYLKNDLVPVAFGDVISDEKLGCTILSTEEIFKLLAKFLKPKKIILISDVEGVYDSKGRVIPEINKKNFSEIKKFLKGADKIDVTGGMAQKVKEAMGMAKGKAEVFIIGGKKGNLERCLKREKVGTRIIFK